MRAGRGALRFVRIVAYVRSERLGFERVELRVHPGANHQLTEPWELGDLHRGPLAARQIHDVLGIRIRELMRCGWGHEPAEIAWSQFAHLTVDLNSATAHEHEQPFLLTQVRVVDEGLLPCR